jgi:hypothetical protein
MTSSNEKIHRPRSKPRTNASLDVMVAKGSGRVRTFRISPRILLMGLIFLVLYIPVSVLVINDYLFMREKQEAQRGQVSRLRAELDDAKKLIFRYHQQVAMLQEHLQTDKTESLTFIKEIPRPQASPPEALEESSGDPPFSKDAWNTVLPPAADIKDLAIFRQGERLKVTFKIVNLKDVGTLEGYAFVVALDLASSPRGLWSYPQAVLLPEGIPSDHRNGFRFNIRNFKSITMTHELGREGALPPILRFLVYDTAGNLLRQEEVEVKPEG